VLGDAAMILGGEEEDGDEFEAAGVACASATLPRIRHDLDTSNLDGRIFDIARPAFWRAILVIPSLCGRAAPHRRQRRQPCAARGLRVLEVLAKLQTELAQRDVDDTDYRTQARWM
jgi:uncharacterized protein YacL